ncbi:hypothetical protein [Sanguibacter sp. 25GB23B1]|uniref:hypothetical protein n=1 Tax=Sanguibacter sp. 25GB23B1 TaxID=3156067 RepID=UPI0032AFADA3
MTGTNETALEKIHQTSVLDSGSYDSAKLAKAAAAIASVADSMSLIAANVGWTGLSAESSAETFVELGRKLYEHSANVTSLAAIADQAEVLVASKRTLADGIGGPSYRISDLMQSAPLTDDQADAVAAQALRQINAEASVMQATAETVRLFAVENPVDPQSLVVSTPPSVGTSDDGWSGEPSQGDGQHGSGSGLGSGGGYTSVDGATGGYVNGAGGYGSVDRAGASGFAGSGAGAGGSIAAGGSGGSGSPGMSAGVIGAGSAGLLGGARSGALGGAGSGLFGGGGAGSRAGGASVAGTPGAGGTAGGRGAGVPGTVAGATGSSGTSGTSGGMMGGGGAGGAGGSAKKGKRSSAGYLAPRIDDDPSNPRRTDAMRAGSRATLAAQPPPPPVDEPDGDRW